jgi:hypothetical protein
VQRLPLRYETRHLERGPLVSLFFSRKDVWFAPLAQGLLRGGPEDPAANDPSLQVRPGALREWTERASSLEAAYVTEEGQLLSMRITRGQPDAEETLLTQGASHLIAAPHLDGHFAIGFDESWFWGDEKLTLPPSARAVLHSRGVLVAIEGHFLQVHGADDAAVGRLLGSREPSAQPEAQNHAAPRDGRPTCLYVGRSNIVDVRSVPAAARRWLVVEANETLTMLDLAARQPFWSARPDGGRWLLERNVDAEVNTAILNERYTEAIKNLRLAKGIDLPTATAEVDERLKALGLSAGASA